MLRLVKTGDWKVTKTMHHIYLIKNPTFQKHKSEQAILSTKNSTRTPFVCNILSKLISFQGDACKHHNIRS